jgi:hypothetical protein
LYLLGESPGLDEDLGLLGERLKISERAIDVSIPTEHRAKCQHSRCNSGLKIDDRRTDDVKISRAKFQLTKLVCSQSCCNYELFSRELLVLKK